MASPIHAAVGLNDSVRVDVLAGGSPLNLDGVGIHADLQGGKIAQGSVAIAGRSSGGDR